MQGKNLSKFVSVFRLAERENSIRRCVQSNFFWIICKAWFKRRILHAPNQILILVDWNEYVRLIWFKRRIFLPNKIAEREWFPFEQT